MQQTHFSRLLAHPHGTFGSRSALGRFFCSITLLGMLVMAALPTLAAHAQDVETQTPPAVTIQPTAAETTADPSGAPTDAPAATQVETQVIASLQSQTPPASTQAPAALTQAPAAATTEETNTPPVVPTTPVDTATASPAKLQSNPLCQSGEKTADIKLDGVTLSVCAPFLPGDFVTPDPSSSDQIATAATLNPYQEFSITAVAYGLKVSTETLPTAAAGLAGQYLQDLKDARIAQGGQVTTGPDATIFGSPVSSIASLVSLKIHGDNPSSVVIVEWVADAGKRLWIIRYSQEVVKANQPVESIIKAMIQPLANVIVSSKDITGPSTSAKYFAAPNPPPPGAGIIAQAAGDLPFPSWWSGDCDKGHYSASYALGGIYKGVKACGPTGDYNNPVVHFAPGLWGELEWQCVELSMRFMYLAYGILPYSGNGKDVVWNYTPQSTDKVHLKKISNDTKGAHPQAGDVLSYGTSSTYGHTSVVSGSNVDSNGNGTINVIEQNVSNPSNGMETLTVTNWHVSAWMLITGWLTPGNNPVPTLSSISSSPSSTITSAMAGTQGLAMIAYGSNFMGSSVIRWNGASLLTGFVSGNELIAAVPNNLITSGSTAKVTVYTPSPGGGTSSAMVFTINNPVPALSGLSPSTAWIGGSGFTLTVSGSNFVSTSKVLWNGSALSTNYVSGTQLTASVPSSDLTATGAVNITVSNPAPAGGTSGAQTFTVNYRLPTLTSISPTSALADSGNLTLTVKGTNFVPVSVVRWNGANLTTTYSSGTKLTALIPAADLLQSAVIPITVFNPSPGGGTTSAMNFTITNPVPSMSGLSPDHITAGTGTFTLTVNGKNFVPSSIVRWNGIDLTTNSASPTQLTAQVTAQLAANPGWMNITVFNPAPAGGAAGPLTFKVASQTPGVCVAAKTISLGESDSSSNSANGSTNNIDTYPIVSWDMHGPEYTYQFTTAQPATVALNLWDRTVNLQAFVIDGGSGSCSAANALADGSKIVFNAQANHTYYFVVDGYQGATGSYRMTVNAFAPSNGSNIQTARPVFQWPPIEGAKSYTLQVSSSSSFANLLLNTSTSNTSYAVGTALAANHQFYWRVKTNSGSYIYMPKGYLSFQTGNPPSVPKLSSPPANGLVTSYTNLLLDWSDSSLPSGVSLTQYQLQVSAIDTTFATTVIDTTTSQSNYLMSSLTANTKYYWRIQALGSNGSFSNWTSAGSFRVAMLPPSLASPANTTSSVMTTFRPSFSWKPVDGAGSYTIQISTSQTISSTLVNDSASAAITNGTVSYTLRSDLPLNKVLYWRVRAEGSNGPGLWSDIWTFTSANPPSTPNLLSPPAQELVTSYTPLLDWSDSSLPSGVTLQDYWVQVSATDKYFTTTVIDTTTTQSNYPINTALTPNVKYYWRVQALGSNGHSSDWANWRSFRTAITPTSLSSPANDATLTTRLPTFQWGSVTGASSYTLQVSSSSSFSSSILNKTVTGSSYTPSTSLPAHSTLYGRVQVNATNGPSLWSATNTFNTP
ncbi:MAG: CHAP domain-containing protein [Negativicutes bacterium]|nr:CHAP domain-containing protein [Negativicutes bacterium]